MIGRLVRITWFALSLSSKCIFEKHHTGCMTCKLSVEEVQNKSLVFLKFEKIVSTFSLIFSAFPINNGMTKMSRPKYMECRLAIKMFHTYWATQQHMLDRVHHSLLLSQNRDHSFGCICNIHHQQSMGKMINS